MKPLRSVVPVLAALALAGCSPRAENGKIVAAGHVEATEVRLAAKVGGRLVAARLVEGTAVQTGDTLAQLDTLDIRLAIEQARADRDNAASAYRLAVNGPRPEDIAGAKAQVEKAAADLEGAERDFKRMQSLLDDGTGTVKARDDAQTRRDMSAAALDAAQETLKKLRRGSRAEEVDMARAQVAAAGARVAQLEQNRRDATVTAPMSGVITEKLAEPGEVLAAGAPLAVLTNLGDAWLTAYVSEPDLSRLRIGESVTVRTDDGQTRPGHLLFVSPKAEFTPRNVQTRDERVKLVYRIKVGLPNADGLFKPGMPATALFGPFPAAGAGGNEGK